MLENNYMHAHTKFEQFVSQGQLFNTTLNTATADIRGTRRYCATSQKDAGSIPGKVIGIFHWPNPSSQLVDSASNRNEYQESSLMVKAAGA